MEKNHVNSQDKVVAAVTPSTTEAEANAIDLLKKDHDEVDASFKDYEMLADGDGDAGDKRALSPFPRWSKPGDARLVCFCAL